MFEAKFENEYGTLRLSGGNGAVFRTLKIEGLGLPEREFNVAGYAGQPGQVLVSERDLARVITLSGDVNAHGCLRQELAKMVKLLYHSGELTVFSDLGRRKIACRCTTVSEPERHGRDAATLVLQFTCDHPYFSDEKPQEKPLYQRRDLITSAFTLPCVFTERVHRMKVVNGGDVAAEPVITICNDVQEKAAVTLDLACGVTVINHTSGKQIVIEHAFLPGETVTVDIPGRRIISDAEGDITGRISQSSFLSEFVLLPGANDVEVVNYSVGEKISVTMAFNNQYIEAVM